MNGFFRDYTEINKSKIESIVKKVNDLFLKYKKVTSDKTQVAINNNGVLIYGSKEQKFFIDKTNEFRRRLRNGETIDDIMAEALAVVKEAIRRTMNMTPYDVQIEAAISMVGNSLDKNTRQRVIAEMKTGEGKTLVQILVAYLNVLEATKDDDKIKHTCVHVITSNDALAKRDQKANARVFDLLGISSGFVKSRSATRTDDKAQRRINKHLKQEAYKCDVVYATASSIAFDYLEDNIVYDIQDRNISRPLGFAIVDEADDILIDQAINPLKLSHTPSKNGSEYERLLIEREEQVKELYRWATSFLYGKNRKRAMTAKIYNQYFDNRNSSFSEDYAYIRDNREVVLSDRIQKEIGADLGNSEEDNAIFNARYYALIDCIKAKEAFKANVEYRIEPCKDEGKRKIVLIDQNIGRKKYSSKYTNGIQEAIEAKEEFLENESISGKKRYHIEFSKKSSIKAMCTYPDFLSMYRHNVCGMTGTSDEEEFKELYGFETYRVPTRKRNIRIDKEIQLYATLDEKYEAIIELVKKCMLTSRPVLIGTTSVEESNHISALLSKNFIRHQLLNADNEERENSIIEGAGELGSVTVSTNMAGRGTDIKLGAGVSELGGLYVIGTSKNKSFRIDRQLMGRAGRQGDPGESIYFSSLEDDIVKDYYRGALDGLIELYSKKGPIKNSKIINGVQKAQSLRESRDKKTRLDNEKFNASFMEHRRIIYENRNKVLESNLLEFMELVKSIITRYTDILLENNSKQEIDRLIGHIVPVNDLYSDAKGSRVNIINALFNKFKNNFSVKNISNSEVKKYVDNVKKKFLSIIDMYWLGHIEYLEDLKVSVALSPANDPFRDYEIISARAFTKELIPSMYNEMITYALNPNLVFGEYTIKRKDIADEEQHRL